VIDNDLLPPPGGACEVGPAPAYEQLREHTRDIERLKSEF
jgi:hypothetical protein